MVDKYPTARRQKVGLSGTSLTVTIPFEWAEMHGIKKSQSLVVVLSDNLLTIIAPIRREKVLAEVGPEELIELGLNRGKKINA